MNVIIRYGTAMDIETVREAASALFWTYKEEVIQIDDKTFQIKIPEQISVSTRTGGGCGASP